MHFPLPSTVQLFPFLANYLPVGLFGGMFVAGSSLGQCWDLSNHRAKWGMWEGVLFGLAHSPEQSVAILNISHSLSFASLISLK